MIAQFLHDLRSLNDAALHHGVDAQLMSEFEKESGLVFPPEHKELLRTSNGVEAYAGYVRLFGLQGKESIDAVTWNQYDYWKFAWGDRCSAYWCIGETAWGDQYAYSVDSLNGVGVSKVYFLDALSMTPTIVASSFGEFLEKEFIRSAKEPYDLVMKLARQKFGPLELLSHLVYVPSVLLGGTEEIDHVRTMNARSAMICNGDIAVQLDEGPPTGTIKAVQPYEDEMQRMRLQLVWR
jgi:hypothetical protein